MCQDLGAGVQTALLYCSYAATGLGASGHGVASLLGHGLYRIDLSQVWDLCGHSP